MALRQRTQKKSPRRSWSVKMDVVFPFPHRNGETAITGLGFVAKTRIGQTTDDGRCRLVIKSPGICVTIVGR